MGGRATDELNNNCYYYLLFTFCGWTGYAHEQAYQPLVACGLGATQSRRANYYNNFDTHNHNNNLENHNHNNFWTTTTTTFDNHNHNINF